MYNKILTKDVEQDAGGKILRKIHAKGLAEVALQGSAKGPSEGITCSAPSEGKGVKKQFNPKK